MVVTHDGLFYVQRKRLADLALERRMPTIAFASEQWEAGVLATYGPNVPTLYRRAGAFIDKILKGANPADLPVEQRRDFITLVGGTAVAWPLASRAQKSSNVRRVGVLMSTASDDSWGQANSAAFAQGLQQLG